MPEEILYDTCDRGSFNPPTFGPDYEALRGEVDQTLKTIGLVGAGAPAYLRGQVPTGDMILAFRIRQIPGSGGSIYAALRSDASGLTGYAIVIAASGNVVYAYRNNASTEWSGYASGHSAGTTNLVVGDMVTLTLRQGRFEFRINGTLRCWLQDTTALPTPSPTYWFLGKTVGVTETWKFDRIRVSKVNAKMEILPDHPRMALDVDGTSWSGISLAQVAVLTDSTDSTAVYLNGDYPNFVGVFPEERFITGVHLQMDGYGPDGRGVYYRMLNGSQSNLAYYSGYGSYPTLPTDQSSPGWRVPNFGYVSAGPVTGVALQGTRLNGYYPWYTVHIYGYPVPGPSTHRTVLWHPYLDMPLPGYYLDMDDVSANTTRVRQFRVKNISQSLTFANVGISATDIEPVSKASELSFNGGGGYASTFNVSTLAPGAISSVVSVRRITSATVVAGVTVPRVSVTVGSAS